MELTLTTKDVADLVDGQPITKRTPGGIDVEIYPELPNVIAAQISDALGGDSNDAEHDALVAVAEYLGITWVTP